MQLYGGNRAAKHCGWGNYRRSQNSKSVLKGAPDQALSRLHKQSIEASPEDRPMEAQVGRTTAGQLRLVRQAREATPGVLPVIVELPLQGSPTPARTRDKSTVIRPPTARVSTSYCSRTNGAFLDFTASPAPGAVSRHARYRDHRVRKQQIINTVSPATGVFQLQSSTASLGIALSRC